MVKIRLRRIGTKGRPFYRVVVAESATGRNGKFVETLGTYDPVSQPKSYEVNAERALYWLRQGAEPTETAAVVLSRSAGTPLLTFLEERPAHKKKYAFLDKRTAPTTASASVAETPVEAATPVEEPVTEAPAESSEPEVAEAA